MGRLALLFVLVPAIELALLIEVGERIGTFATLLIIVVTGVVGAALARSQGVRVLLEIQQELGQGKLPTAALVAAAIVLVSGALLLTPGLLTDAIGFAGLVPPIRTELRRLLWKRFKGALERQHIQVRTYGTRSEDSVHDADYRPLD